MGQNLDRGSERGNSVQCFGPLEGRFIGPEWLRQVAALSGQLGDGPNSAQESYFLLRVWRPVVCTYVSVCTLRLPTQQIISRLQFDKCIYRYTNRLIKRREATCSAPSPSAGVCKQTHATTPIAGPRGAMGALPRVVNIFCEI
jgi:hypothetical protein